MLLCWTSCAITRCREIMTPQLSIVKTRFAKASLRPRCARHRSWGATCLFPNACVGHSASQLMRWTLSFPIDALDTQLPSSRDGSSSNILGRAEHPSTAGYANPDNDLVGHTSSNALRIFRAPITLVDFTTKEGARPGWHLSSNAGT